MPNHLYYSLTFKRLCLVALSSLFVALSVNAQTNGTTPLGLSPGSPAGSYPLSDFETVNLYNGDLNFHLNLLNVGGRGSAGYPVSIHLGQKWNISKEINPGHSPYYFGHSGWWSEDFGTARTLDVGRLQVRRGGTEDFYGPSCSVYRYKKTLTRITFTAPDGTEFEMRDQLTGGQPAVPAACSSGFNRQKVFVTADGTSATYTSDDDIIDAYWWSEAGEDEYRTSGYMVLRDGTKFRIDNGNVTWMRDRNGNKVTFSYDGFKRVTGITDSLNRQVTISYDISSGGTAYYDQISFKGFGGASRTLRIGHCLRSDAMRSDISVPSPLFSGLTGIDNSNPFVVNYLQLPDGRQYQLQYTAYAEIARVVLPTGGAIEYDWVNGLTDGATSGLFSIGGDKYVYRRVVERRLYSSGGSGSGFDSRMTYSRPESTTSNAGYVAVDQYNSSGTLLGRSQHYFNGSPRASFAQKQYEYPAWQDSREYKNETLDANGTTVIQRVETTFEQRAAVSWWTGSSSTAPPNDVRPTQIVTTLLDTNQVSKKTFGYDDSVPYNNQNNVKEYDFGSGTEGSLLRETRTTFVTSTTYTDLSLLSLPSEVAVYDGGGIRRARTTYEYDNYATDSTHAALQTYPRSGYSEYAISGFDSAYNSTSSNLTRGNATATTHYLVDGSGTVTGSVGTYSQYDVVGNVIKAIDARGNATSVDYGDRFGAPDTEAQSNSAPSELPSLTSYTFATKIANAVGHIAYTQFDYYLGRPVNAEDANGIIFSAYSDSDALDRPTKIISAVNGGTATKTQTIFSYDDTNRIVTTTSDQIAFADGMLKGQVVYDGFGRSTEKRTYEGGTNYIVLLTQYDPLGRAYKTSNPLRPWLSETAVWTTSAFDALGRVTSVTTPDNAVLSTAYSGNAVTVTDQAGKARKRVIDGLGRLSSVYEDPSGLNYQTSYGYDVLDNLTTVTQGSQTRSFTYDSLKRLSSATNPESGTTSYQYDENGNLLVKTDSRSVSSHFSYDALNRMSRRWYNNSSSLSSSTNNSPALPSGVGATAEVTYAYDASGVANSKGRLTSVSSSVSTYSYTGYEALGRVSTATQTIGGQNYTLSYTYDLAGHQKSITYPSGHAVNYSYDEAGRLNDYSSAIAFSGNLGDGATRNYAAALRYDAIGHMQEEKFGTSTPLYHKQHFNVRGQQYDVRLSTHSWVDNEFDWNRGAIVSYYSSVSGYTFGGSGTDNNGNLLRSATYIPVDDSLTSYSYFNQDYTYDSLNRLGSVAEYQYNQSGLVAASFGQTYTYDRWGNRTLDISGSPPHTWGGINALQTVVDTNTNRIYAPSDPSHNLIDYDSAGNQTKDYLSWNGTRAYDAEDKITTANNGVTSAYNYDGNGQRVSRKVGNLETWQVYGVGGELMAEYAPNAPTSIPDKEYGYRNGQLLVTAAAVNLAQGTSPTQSSTFSNAGVNFTANLAVDGNTDGAFWDVSSATTNYASQNWWQVDLGSSQSIGSIQVWPRTDCCPEHTANMYVFVSDNPFTSTDLNITLNQSGVSNYWVAGNNATAANVAVNRTGRYIRVQRNDSQYLVLAEVRILRNTADIEWLVADHLGTPRMVSNSTGALSSIKRHDYLPFGEEIVAGQGGRSTGQGYSINDGVRQKFTGKERDNETNLDYFGARFYLSIQGRFTVPDELKGGPLDVVKLGSGEGIDQALPFAEIENPQSLNKYQYAYNNPLALVDDDGHDVAYANDRLRDMVAKIGEKSTSFAQEINDLHADHSIRVVFVERGLHTNDEGSTGDSKIEFFTDGSVTVTVYVDTYGRTDEPTVEHEVGHAKDARTNRKQLEKDAVKTRKNKGTIAEVPHNDRPEEKRANQFKKQVEQEKKQYKKAQEAERKRQKEERKRQKEEERKGKKNVQSQS